MCCGGSKDEKSDGSCSGSVVEYDGAGKHDYQ